MYISLNIYKQGIIFTYSYLQLSFNMYNSEIQAL